MAVTFDFGKCASCGENNSKSLSACRKCGALLPWAKAVAPKGNANLSTPKIGLGDIAYGAMGVQILGGFIFVAGIFLKLGNIFGFFPTFPLAGYITMIIGGALWGFGQSMD